LSGGILSYNTFGGDSVRGGFVRGIMSWIHPSQPGYLAKHDDDDGRQFAPQGVPHFCD